MNVTGPGNTQQDEWREKHMGEIMNACCFTGHRENKLHRTEKEILKDLDREISRALEDGYTTFICGMAYGVDIWAGEIVAKKRFWNHRIKLIAAVPFEGFEARWISKASEKGRRSALHLRGLRQLCISEAQRMDGRQIHPCYCCL